MQPKLEVVTTRSLSGHQRFSTVATKRVRMHCVFHLTSHGWRKGPCAKNERLETWRVETEHYGSLRITRSACIWRARSLDMETRRLLHRRFGSPPIVQV